MGSSIDLYLIGALENEDRLGAGAYELSVRGGAAVASPDDLGFLAIEVTRVP